MKKLDRFLLGTLLLGAVSLTLDYSRPSPLRDALASSQESAAELGAAFQSFKNRGASEVPSVAGVALETAQPQTEARREVSQQLIPEVLSLKRGELLPGSLFDKYDTNAIAESLVERLYRMSSKPEDFAAAGDTLNMWTETELHRFSWSKNFLRFVRTGIKNQFETKTSNGLRNLSLRNTVEEALIGVRLIPDGMNQKSEDTYSDEKINSLRPKYGTVFFPNLGVDINAAVTGYGNFILIFNDRLKLRSTYAYGDSIARPEGQEIGVSGETFWSQKTKSAIDGASKEHLYIESHIWGGIDIEDVQAIGVIREFPDDNYFNLSTPFSFRKLIIDAGFKVVEFELLDKSYVYRKARTLSEGDPAKLGRWIQRVRAGEIVESTAP